MVTVKETRENGQFGGCDMERKYSNNNMLDKALDLSGNGLRELSLPMLKEYKLLKCLYLEKNMLEELPEKMFLELPFLSWLDVRNNRLTGLPKSIANHEFLEVILLQGNQMQSLPMELGLVPKLRGLQISGNPIVFPPEDIIQKGITSILRYLRDECKACSIYTRENVSDNAEYHHNAYSKDEHEAASAGISKDSLISDIRRNTTACVTHCLCTPKGINKGSATENECLVEENNILSELHQPEKFVCKSSIRVMANPKSYSPKARNSAPALSRVKGVQEMRKTSNNKAASNNKHILMRQNAIIQKRKNEEELKCWREQMQKMKDKSASQRKCVPTSEKHFPYGVDSEYMKMPSRGSLHKVTLEVKNHTHGNLEKRCISADIGNEISLIFNSLQSLKCNAENPLASPRSQQRATKDKLLKINELKSKIGDLKKKIPH